MASTFYIFAYAACFLILPERLFLLCSRVTHHISIFSFGAAFLECNIINMIVQTPETTCHASLFTMLMNHKDEGLVKMP